MLHDIQISGSQKTILKAFGMDKNYVLQKARMISEELYPRLRQEKRQKKGRINTYGRPLACR